MIATHSSIIIVTAPSGTGKTTLTRRLVSEAKDIRFSVSITTRPIRKGELDGEHYWYLDEKAFMKLVNEQRMVEWANVFGNLYGTSKDEIKRILDLGERALLEIDVQGAENIRKQYPDACDIFIMPPSVEALWSRLKTRGTDSLDVRWRRLKTAKAELKAGRSFRHFIINDDLEKAYTELKNLVMNGNELPLSYKKGVEHCDQLIREFEKAEWNSEHIPTSMMED
jgi:guanylate kinase